MYKEVINLMNEIERKRCIAHTLKGTFYVGMAIVKHNIKKIIKEKHGYTIFEGELWLRHNLTKSNIHIFIRSDLPNKDNPTRCYGYIDKVMIQCIDDEEFRDSDGYEIRQLIR